MKLIAKDVSLSDISCLLKQLGGDNYTDNMKQFNNKKRRYLVEPNKEDFFDLYSFNMIARLAKLHLKKRQKSENCSKKGIRHIICQEQGATFFWQ